MRKVSILFLLVVIAMSLGVAPVFAATVIGTAPTVSTGVPAVDQIINNEIATAFNDAITEANDSLARYSDQKELAKGFANANAFSSHGGTFQGYQNYSKLAVTTGVMGAVQGPSTDPDYYDGIEDEIEEKGDLYAGVGAGISFFNIGMKANSVFKKLPSDMYLNLKFGSVSIDPSDEISVSSTLIGVGANYTLVKPNDGSGAMKWRGVSIGGGLYYHTSKVSVGLDLDGEVVPQDFTVDAGPGTITGTVSVDPSVILELKSKSLTIPFDIVTSVQVAYLLNFTLGAGLDFNLGSTDIVVVGDGETVVNITDDPAQIIQSTAPGTVLIDGSTRGVSPSFGRLRLIGGIGFNFGPAKLDFPVSYYVDSGAAVGVTLGVVL